MAQDNANKRPTVEELVKDPRYVEEKNFLWGAFDAWAKEKEEQRLRDNPPKQPGFIDGLLGPFGPKS